MRRLALLSAVTAFAAVIGLASTPAFAASTAGTIIGKSVGSVYSRSGSDIIRTINKAGTGTYSLQVKNTGTSLAQYRVKVTDNHISTDPSTLSLKVGSLETITLAQTDDGYVTTPIAGGKSITLTFTVKTPSITSANARWGSQIVLWDLSNTVQLGFIETYTELSSTTGTKSNDAYISGPGGQLPVTDRAADSQGGIAGAPALKVGQTATFTLKVTNHSAAAAQSILDLYDAGSCEGGVYNVVVKTGTTDVSAAVQAGTYVTPAIGAGKTVSYSLAFKLITAPATCNNLCCGYWMSGYGIAVRQAADPYNKDEYPFLFLTYAA